MIVKNSITSIRKSLSQFMNLTKTMECQDIYNFTRTGCKGCPFALKLQNELDTLEKFFPAERKQCEALWKPVYEEYRKLGYRLRDIEKGK